MRKTIFISCLLALACNTIHIPFVVSFMPDIEVGDVWVYSVRDWGLAVNDDFIRTITVTKVVKNSGGSEVFNVAIRDSGASGCGYAPWCYPFDTTYSVDSIILTPDTVIAPCNTYFSISTKDTTNSAWGLGTICQQSDIDCNENCGYCIPYNNSVEYIRNRISRTFTSVCWDSTVFLENVGLIYNQGGSSQHGSGQQWGTLLKTFNGKTPEQIPQESR